MPSRSTKPTTSWMSLVRYATLSARQSRTKAQLRSRPTNGVSAGMRPVIERMVGERSTWLATSETVRGRKMAGSASDSSIQTNSGARKFPTIVSASVRPNFPGRP